MNNQDKSKEDIKELVNDFRNNYQNYKKLAESDVETKLVEELFIKILGWDKKDFIKQEKVRRGEKGGRADYAFYIGDRIVFFLEAKKIGVPLEKEADKQVISYALSRKVPLAISTNFEQMNIFCVEQENALKNVFRNFRTPEDYINNFTDLWFLSKESFEQGLLLKKAEDEGRLKRRISIDKPLLEDFMRIRSLIANDIEKNYQTKYNINEKDEIIQRIIDRLIFIRRSEDVGINPDNLTLEEIKHLPGNRAYPRLKHIFSKYDDKYNSGLFTPNKDNDCDKITIDGEIIKKLIYYLYESHNKEYVYNFEWIDADILGQVYEQYLGKILAQTKSGKAKLKEGQAHRKEQGIYYTPTYVVDYIVKNTVCELLKDKKVDANQIKILDPACGSGSFLIKAFDYIQKHFSNGEEAKQHRLDSQGAYSIKTEILKNNIFGVDLDNKAVEITKLNLLLKAAEKFRKLPKELDKHICWGNSLIEDDSVSEHAFKWIDDFQEGTFDAVIGNPPYFNLQTVRDEKQSVFFEKNYFSYRGKADILYLFIEKANKVLKDGGYLGLIVANYFLRSHYADKLREFISKNYIIIKIADFCNIKVFPEANVDTCIVILKKSKPKNNKFTYGLLVNDAEIISFLNEVEKSRLIKNNSYKIVLDSQSNKNNLPWKFGESEFSNITLLSEICNIGKGVATGNDEIFVVNKDIVKSLKLENEILDPVVNDSSIERYQFNVSNKLLIRTKRETDISKYPNIKNYLESKKNELKNRYAVKKEGLNWFEIVRYNDDLFGQEIREQIYAYYRSTHNKFAYSNNRFVTLTTTFVITLKKESKIHLKYLLGILNSKMIESYSRRNAKKMGKCFEYSSNFIGSIPIKIIPEPNQQSFIKLVDRILFLNKQLQEIGDKKTAQSDKLEEEKRKIDDEIDDLVYKLYKISAEEKKIIKDSLR